LMKGMEVSTFVKEYFPITRETRNRKTPKQIENTIRDPVFPVMVPPAQIIIMV